MFGAIQPQPRRYFAPPYNRGPLLDSPSYTGDPATQWVNRANRCKEGSLSKKSCQHLLGMNANNNLWWMSPQAIDTIQRWFADKTAAFGQEESNVPPKQYKGATWLFTKTKLNEWVYGLLKTLLVSWLSIQMMQFST